MHNGWILVGVQNLIARVIRFRGEGIVEAKL